ncbi:MAG: hydrogenase accessory protein HypB [Archaeoglobales archaeon]|nr:MAG: hydrogenase accessory protein HypB [Archaeoglobales archaeon]
MHKIEVDAEVDLLEENRRLAEENRKILRERGITTINVMGAIGSGKTLLIEKTVESLKDFKVGAILGDVIAKDDYKRVARHGVRAIPLNTGKECHLDAHLVHHALEDFDLDGLDVLFIENVGNLICPVDFDLGEDYRVVMVSVTEGDDVVSKHPEIFRLADVIIINKVALADAVEADVEKMFNDARRLNPKAKIIKMDLKRDVGFDEWMEWLRCVLQSREGLLR